MATREFILSACGLASFAGAKAGPTHKLSSGEQFGFAAKLWPNLHHSYTGWSNFSTIAAEAVGQASRAVYSAERMTGSKNPGLPAGWQAEACPTFGSGFS
jgi:hypothetical protein